MSGLIWLLKENNCVPVPLPSAVAPMQFQLGQPVQKLLQPLPAPTPVLASTALGDAASPVVAPVHHRTALKHKTNPAIVWKEFLRIRTDWIILILFNAICIRNYIKNQSKIVYLNAYLLAL